MAETGVSGMKARSLLRYAWPLPVSLVGLAAAGVACALGARARRASGVLEVGGGLLAARTPNGRFAAITLGHVVLGRSHELLEVLRAHEHAHVRQYERWGPLLVPLYLGAGMMEWARGRSPYWHNRFEREARAAERRRESGVRKGAS